MSEAIHKQKHLRGALHASGQEGFALLGVLVLFAVIMGVVAVLAGSTTRAARGEARDDDARQEYWLANANAATLEAALRRVVPERFSADVSRARALAGMRPLPVFDAPDASESRPVWSGGAPAYEPAQATSLLGDVDAYAASGIAAAQEAAQRAGVEADSAQVAELREAFRRDAEGVQQRGRSELYALAYTIHARAGRGGRIQPSGVINLGTSSAGCAASVTATANPASVRRGRSATLRISYSSADELRVVDNSSGGVIDHAVAYEDGLRQTTVTVAPASTTTYSVRASSGMCRAETPPVTVEVAYNDAAFVSQSVPSSVAAGGAAAVSVSMRNTGTTTWTPGSYFLGSADASWGAARVPVPRAVAPGEVVTFNFTINAPTACPGAGNLSWRMVEEEVEWFGEASPEAAVQVNCSTPSYDGSLESVDCGSIVGWAWDARRPDAPVNVEVLIDGVSQGQVTASEARPDLAAAGKGDGRHGFSLPTPQAAKDNRVHTVAVRFPDGGALANSPRTLQCSSACSMPTVRLSAVPVRVDPNNPLITLDYALGITLTNATSVRVTDQLGNIVLSQATNLSVDPLVITTTVSPLGLFSYRVTVEGSCLNVGVQAHAVIQLLGGVVGSVGVILGGTPTPTPTPPAAGCPTVSLNASRYVAAAGEDVTLSWTSSGASLLTLDNGVGQVEAPSGQRTIRFDSAGRRRVTITSFNADRSCSTQSFVEINVGEPAPPECNTRVALRVEASPRPDRLRLVYDAFNASRLDIDGGVGEVPPPSGFVDIVKPAVETAYTITARSADERCPVAQAQAVYVPPASQLGCSTLVASGNNLTTTGSARLSVTVLPDRLRLSVNASLKSVLPNTNTAEAEGFLGNGYSFRLRYDRALRAGSLVVTRPDATTAAFPVTLGDAPGDFVVTASGEVSAPAFDPLTATTRIKGRGTSCTLLGLCVTVTMPNTIPLQDSYASGPYTSCP